MSWRSCQDAQTGLHKAFRRRLSVVTYPKALVLSRMNLQKISLCAAWLCVAFVVYATLSPFARPELTVDEPARIVLLERFMAYALMGFLLTLAYPRRTIFVPLLIFGLAVGLELSQLLIPHRDARAIDAIEKLAGGLIGIWLAMLFLWLVERLLRDSPKTVVEPRRVRRP
jgi:VanZ family protein